MKDLFLTIENFISNYGEKIIILLTGYFLSEINRIKEKKDREKKEIQRQLEIILDLFCECQKKFNSYIKTGHRLFRTHHDSDLHEYIKSLYLDTEQEFINMQEAQKLQYFLDLYNYDQIGKEFKKYLMLIIAGDPYSIMRNEEDLKELEKCLALVTKNVLNSIEFEMKLNFL